MGYRLDRDGFARAVAELAETYRVLAPVVKTGKGRFTDTDVILYDEVKDGSEIELIKKSDYSFKEALTPLSETLFFFTENQVKEADIDERPTLIFLRSCDLHALKRQDQIYLENGAPDWFYERRRKKVRFALIGCTESGKNCFCVSMGTNTIDAGYDFAVNPAADGVTISVPENAASVSVTTAAGETASVDYNAIFSAVSAEKLDVKPAFVTENAVNVHIPEEIPASVLKDSLWDEYTSRCIGCGRCNFVCPTCTCFTMQDVFYTENGKVGERRRVAASCMVDGFTNVVAAAASTGRLRGSACASRSCTRSTTIGNASATKCASAAGAATMSALSTFRIQILFIK